MEGIIKLLLDYLISKGYTLYTVVLIIAMTTFIFLVLSLIKKPIKALTLKIKNDKLRKLANKTIILLSFGFSIGLWFLANKLAPTYFQINRAEILLTGALPVVAYALGDGILTKSSAQAIVTKILEVTNDGDVTKEEVKDIAKTVKDETTKANKSNAESTLDDLLKK